MSDHWQEIIRKDYFVETIQPFWNMKKNFGRAEYLFWYNERYWSNEEGVDSRSKDTYFLCQQCQFKVVGSSTESRKSSYYVFLLMLNWSQLVKKQSLSLTIQGLNICRLRQWFYSIFSEKKEKLVQILCENTSIQILTLLILRRIESQMNFILDLKFKFQVKNLISNLTLTWHIQN